METSDILLWGGVALAVWYFMPPSAPAVPAAGTAVTPELQTYGLLQAMGSAPILAAAHNSGAAPSAAAQLTPAQWNVYMTQVSGVPGPQLGTSMTTAVPLAAYWAALMAWASQQATASLTPATSSTPVTAGVAGLSGLGSRTHGSQPGRGVNSFPPPPDPNVGRYDMSEMDWQ